MAGKKAIDIERLYIQKKNEDEDKEILTLFDRLSKGSLSQEINYLEAGSGVGRFPVIVKKKYSHFNITCFEINNELVKKTEGMGLKSIEGNLLSTGFADSEFDIVHCSHVIEHFSYPDIATLLDELLRITKKDGYVIIRSPLMHDRFYVDIDHVRPYPPDCILNYFKHEQQQKNARYKIKEAGRYYRRNAIMFKNINRNKLVSLLNIAFQVLWIFLKFPRAKESAYCLFLKKSN